MKQNLPPDDPCEWLNRARSNMNLAYACGNNVLYEDLCFQAEQAAEKAIKAIFVAKRLLFPHTHDIHVLLTILAEHGIEISGTILRAERLSVYAVQTRYPGFHAKVEESHYKQAVSLAEQVLFWAEKIINDTMIRE